VSTSSGSPRPSLRRPTPVQWLLIAAVLFVIVTFLASWLRAIEFETTTWDQGLYQQALWSTAHGRNFYETADVETGGYGSLLEVHSVFLFYLLAPLYDLFPYETTLFAVQSVIVALAAFPLYLLARDVAASRRLGLLAGLAYLAWTPTLSSTLYDFHPEAFLPVELFTLVLLWERRQYAFGFLVAGIAFCTLEIAPVLTFFVGIWGLLTLRPTRLASPNRLPRAPFVGRWLARLRTALRSPKVRASLLLLGASAVAYWVLLYLRTDLLIGSLGTYPLPVPASGYVIGATPSALGLSVPNLGVGLGAKLAYWGLALALLAFVPIWAPRALVLAIPWWSFTMLSANLNYVTLGFQYGFIAGSSLLVAFAYGLPRLRDALRARGYLDPRPEPVPPRRWRIPLRALRRPRFALVVGVVVLVGANLALTPLDPALQNAPLGSAYRLSYVPRPGDAAVDRLAGILPAGAVVVASDDLFPLVANDENAYSLLWTADPGLALPFNATHLPSFVFLAQNALGAVPEWLANALYTNSSFGVRGIDWSSGVGTVLLFQAGYSGTATEFGGAPVAQGTFFGGSLATPPAGSAGVSVGSTYSTVVESVPGIEGTAWRGPSITVAPGTYAIRASLEARPLTDNVSGSTTVLRIVVSGFGEAALTATNLTLSQLNYGEWVTVALDVKTTFPVIGLVVTGIVLVGSVVVTLNYLSIVTEVDG
jgi:uncharacterized membrane protein